MTPYSVADTYLYLTGSLQLQDKMGEEENLKTMLITFSIHLLSNFFHSLSFRPLFRT